MSLSTEARGAWHGAGMTNVCEDAEKLDSKSQRSGKTQPADCE